MNEFVLTDAEIDAIADAGETLLEKDGFYDEIIDNTMDHPGNADLDVDGKWLAENEGECW